MAMNTNITPRGVELATRRGEMLDLPQSVRIRRCGWTIAVVDQ
jgi:hypothetical protein